MGALPKKKKSRGSKLATAKQTVKDWLADNKDRALTFDSAPKHIPYVPTGDFIIDHYLSGIGGLPRGRIVEVYGPEGAGKTTFLLHAIVNAQKKGGSAHFIDAEHALDASYLVRLGGTLNDNQFVLSQPDSGEEAIDIAISSARAGWPTIICVDSVAALTPQAELDGEMGDEFMGLQARMMGKAMRKLSAAISKHNICLVFTNQIRMKIGMSFGSPETTPGGNALKFYASQRYDVRAVGKLKEGKTIVGHKTKIRCTKNKLSPPFREAVVHLIYGEGFQSGSNLFNIAAENKSIKAVVHGDGAAYKVGGKDYRGRARALEAFSNDPFLQMEVEAEAIKLARAGTLVVPSLGDDD